MLVSRDAFQLAGSLEKLTGNKAVSQTIFGIGVVGMAVSTIIILMLINGFCLTEALGAKMSGVVHRTGSLLPGITGALRIPVSLEQRRRQILAGRAHQYFRDGAAADRVLHFFLHDQ